MTKDQKRGLTLLGVVTVSKADMKTPSAWRPQSGHRDKENNGSPRQRGRNTAGASAGAASRTRTQIPSLFTAGATSRPGCAPLPNASARSWSHRLLVGQRTIVFHTVLEKNKTVSRIVQETNTIGHLLHITIPRKLRIDELGNE